MTSFPIAYRWEYGHDASPLSRPVEAPADWQTSATFQVACRRTKTSERSSDCPVEQQRDGFSQSRRGERLFEERLTLPELAHVHHLIDVAGDVQHRQVRPDHAHTPGHFIATQDGHVQIRD